MEIQFSINLNGKRLLVTEPKKVTHSSPPPSPRVLENIKKENEANQHNLTTVVYPSCHILQDGFNCRCN